MGVLARIAARIRGVQAEDYAAGGEEFQAAANNRGDLSFAPGLPPLTELVRLGESWQVKTATAFAALVTEPTVVAGLSLHNNESADGPSYLIESIALWERVADATQQNQLAAFAMLTPRGGTMPSAGTLLASATSIKSLSGRNGYSGSAIVRAGATVVDDGWFPHGPSAPGAAAVAGGAWRVTDVPLKGLYFVPPGAAFSLHAAKIAATASQLHAVIRFHVAQLIWK